MVSFNKDGKIIAEEVLKNEKGKVKKYYDNGNLKIDWLNLLFLYLTFLSFFFLLLHEF